MRVETPPVSIYYVSAGPSRNKKARGRQDEKSARFDAIVKSNEKTTTLGRSPDPWDVVSVAWLWETMSTLSGHPVELRAGNWVLEEVGELTEEYTNDRWELVVLYKGSANYGNYMKLKHVDGLLELSGSSSSAAHQLAAQFTDALLAVGFTRFNLYSEGRRAARNIADKRSTSAQKTKSLHMVRRVLQPLVRVDRAIMRHLSVIVETAGFAWRQFRDAVVFSVAAASLIGLEVLPRLVGAVAVGTLISAILIVVFRISIVSDQTSSRSKIQ
jgi:hypothetical protein